MNLTIAIPLCSLKLFKDSFCFLFKPQGADFFFVLKNIFHYRSVSVALTLADLECKMDILFSASKGVEPMLAVA